MQTANVDPLNLSILRILQKNGRATVNDISETVGLNGGTKPVARRPPDPAYGKRGDHRRLFGPDR